MPFLRLFLSHLSRKYGWKSDCRFYQNYRISYSSTVSETNITKKSFGGASIKFQPSLRAFQSLFHTDHGKSARIESYRHSSPSVKANTAERIVKTANSFIS